MNDGPSLPASISVEEIDIFLDRVAEEIVANQNGDCLLPMYQWLERQRAARLERSEVMRSVMARVDKRKQAA